MELLRLPNAGHTDAVTQGLEAARSLAVTLPGPDDEPPPDPSAMGSPMGSGMGSANPQVQEQVQVQVQERPVSEVVKKRRPQQSRGTRLPDDWQPHETLIAWTRKHCPDVNGAYTFEVFRDYWRAQPGQKGVKLDWEGTWRNWVRREQQNSGSSRGGNPEPDLGELR